METVMNDYPKTMWLLERFLGSLLIFFFLWVLRICWRTARQNQKLALGDVYEYSMAERRGLLLPVAHANRGY